MLGSGKSARGEASTHTPILTPHTPLTAQFPVPCRSAWEFEMSNHQPHPVWQHLSSPAPSSPGTASPARGANSVKSTTAASATCGIGVANEWPVLPGASHNGPSSLPRAPS